MQRKSKLEKIGYKINNSFPIGKLKAPWFFFFILWNAVDFIFYSLCQTETKASGKQNVTASFRQKETKTNRKENLTVSLRQKLNKQIEQIGPRRKCLDPKPWFIYNRLGRRFELDIFVWSNIILFQILSFVLFQILYLFHISYNILKRSVQLWKLVYKKYMRWSAQKGLPRTNKSSLLLTWADLWRMSFKCITNFFFAYSQIQL